VANPDQTDDDSDDWGPPCDCNDDDPTINPGVFERSPVIGQPGVDDNCNGVVDLCGSIAIGESGWTEGAAAALYLAPLAWVFVRRRRRSNR